MIFIAQVNYQNISSPETKLFLTWRGLKRWLDRMGDARRRLDTPDRTYIASIELHGMFLKVGAHRIVSCYADWPADTLTFEKMMSDEFGKGWRVR